MEYLSQGRFSFLSSLFITYPFFSCPICTDVFFNSEQGNRSGVYFATNNGGNSEQPQQLPDRDTGITNKKRKKE